MTRRARSVQTGRTCAQPPRAEGSRSARFTVAAGSAAGGLRAPVSAAAAARLGAAFPAVRALPTTLALLVLSSALPASAIAQVDAPAPDTEEPPPPPALKVQRPTEKVLIREGQDGRLLLGGRWYFRQDDEFVGETQRWFAQRDLTGWSPVGVPSSWNATDLTENKGTVGWYRKEFSLPEAPKESAATGRCASRATTTAARSG